MPLYEYRCLKCGEVTEVLQKLNDPPLRRCSHCSGKVEKLFSRTSFQLKGGGWYASGYGQESSKGSPESKPTDSASGEAKAPAAGDSSASEPSSKKKDSKAEGASKGDAKGDSKKAKAAVG